MNVSTENNDNLVCRTYGTARCDFVSDGIEFRAYREHDGIITLASKVKITAAQYKRARRIAEHAFTFYEVALRRSCLKMTESKP